MIAKASKNSKDQYQSTYDGLRVCGEFVVYGAADTVTNTMLDIVEIDRSDIGAEPDISTVRDVLTDKILASELTEDEVTALCAAYPQWTPGLPVTVDSMLAYNDKLYRVIQVHTTQADWTPDATPALFTPAYPENIIPDWVQPTGGHDAYNTGDQVQFNGAVYESVIDANVWSPTVYPAGWVLVA